MKFVCIGYFNEKDLEKLTEAEQEQMIIDYAAFFEEIKRNKKLLCGKGLQSATEGCRLWKEEGSLKSSVLDKEKEQIGGIFIIEAENLEEAKSIVERHPGLKIGWFQIRPVDEELTQAVGVN